MTTHDRRLRPEFGPEYPAEISPRVERRLAIAESTALLVSSAHEQITISLELIKESANRT